MVAPVTTFIDGTVNIAGITNPGAYIDVIPPTPYITGAPTNIEGIVGVARWGPVGAPVFVSGPVDCAYKFGYPSVHANDLPTFVWAASEGGPSTSGAGIQFAGVRVTDGTDVAASVVVLTTCITFTAKYTGTLGNQITVTLSTGTKPNSFAASVAFPGVAPELFNNVTGSGNAFWVNLAAAINNGNATSVGPSQSIIATAGAGTTAPTLGTAYALTGGTDGSATITTAIMLGQDTLPRKGMYALRGTGLDAFALCGVVDNTSWTSQTAFGISENTFPVLTDAAGSSIATAVSNRVSAALDYFYAWYIVGDWPSFFDTYNGYIRLVSPQAIALGLIGNLAPQFSPLNKPINGIVKTQRADQQIPYAAADITQAELGGVDLIVPPVNCPGGNYYTFITGRNSSSNTAANGLEFTRMTYFLAKSIASVAGQFVGLLQSSSNNDPTRQKVSFTLSSFMQGLTLPQVGAGGYGLIDQFAVKCDLSNNPANTRALGYLFATIVVLYLNTIRYFVVKLAGSGTPQITVQTTPPAPNQFS